MGRCGVRAGRSEDDCEIDVVDVEEKCSRSEM